VGQSDFEKLVCPCMAKNAPKSTQSKNPRMLDDLTQSLPLYKTITLQNRKKIVKSLFSVENEDAVGAAAYCHNTT
jgi:hypothetical protein